mmetsp:Transcript_40844/g.85289  ORF Transcript_40844/g.85289 Transcript_40844/m.85289 type:complete len:107 (-) Transcript_40844:189-509(-)
MGPFPFLKILHLSSASSDLDTAFCSSECAVACTSESECIVETPEITETGFCSSECAVAGSSGIVETAGITAIGFCSSECAIACNSESVDDCDLAGTESTVCLDHFC